MCYPDPDLMFRLAVTSSALHCVTDAEDIQLVTGQRGRGECGDVKQTCSVCVCVCGWTLVYTPTSTCFCPNLHLALFSVGGEVHERASDVCAD